MRGKTQRRPKLLVINDLSESRRHAPEIREFVRTFYAGPLSTGPFRIVNASKIRETVFRRLNKDTKQRKYDLILTGDRGGTLMFTSGNLRRFGKKVMRIPWSSHARTEEPWHRIVQDAALGLGKNPRILILESDVGPQLQTTSKMDTAKYMILGARDDAEVRKFAGVASRFAMETRVYRLRKKNFDYVAYPTAASPIRLSELVDEFSEGRKFEGRKAALMGRMQELQKRRGLTGTLPH